MKGKYVDVIFESSFCPSYTFFEIAFALNHVIWLLEFRVMCRILDLNINLLVVYRESVNLIGYITRRLSAVSINLLVVYRESVNLIGYITRRLSADSLQL